jgi:hypothetical protein
VVLDSCPASVNTISLPPREPMLIRVVYSSVPCAHSHRRILFEKRWHVLALGLVKAREGDGVVDEGVVAQIIRKRCVQRC